MREPSPILELDLDHLLLSKKWITIKLKREEHSNSRQS